MQHSIWSGSVRAVINVCEAEDRWERGVGWGRVMAMAAVAVVLLASSSSFRVDIGRLGLRPSLLCPPYLPLQHGASMQGFAATPCEEQAGGRQARRL